MSLIVKFKSFIAKSVSIVGRAAATIPLVIRGATSQSANLTEWTDSSSSKVAHVDPSGGILTLGTLSFNTDTILLREAANTLAQRNGVNPQLSHLYNTYTNASNYERGVFKWSSNVLTIGTEALGTGAVRNISFSGGSVGIGNTAPSAKLHVVSTSEQTRIGYDTSNYFSYTVASAGQTTLTMAGASPTFTQSASRTGTFSYLLQNSSTGSASSAFIVDTAGTGDPYARFTIAATSWAIGCDNSTSDSFKISNNATLGTNDYLTITTAGDASFFGSIQPASYKSADGSTGATGTFTTTDLKTVTVKDGIITSIV